MTTVPSSVRKPSDSTVRATVSAIPSICAARKRSAGSPTGSAAASNRTRRASRGSFDNRRMKLSSIPADSGKAAGRPNPSVLSMLMSHRPARCARLAARLRRHTFTVPETVPKSQDVRTRRGTVAAFGAVARPVMRPLVGLGGSGIRCLHGRGEATK